MCFYETVRRIKCMQYNTIVYTGLKFYQIFEYN